MKAYLITKIAQHRGAPRFWLEGSYPLNNGFEPGSKFNVVVDENQRRITLQVIETGERIVSSRTRHGKTMPVIDINSKQILQCFEGMNCVRVVIRHNLIHIFPEVVEYRKAERLQRIKDKLNNNEPLVMGSLSHGGGVMSHAIHNGLAKAGFNSRLSFANDIRDDLLEQAATHNDVWDADTVKVAAPMQHVVLDQWLLSKLGKVDVIECGISCSGASVAGRSKNGTAMAEQHDEVGHLIAPFIQIVGHLNPVAVILENVKPYQSTASMWILRHSLRDMGYTVHETTLNATEFNELEKRERLCVVAVTQGIDFDFESLNKPPRLNRKLGEVLDQVDSNDSRWSSFDYLVKHQDKHVARGNGFKMQVFDEESEHINTVTKGYAKIRSTDPKIINRETGLMRQLSVAEHARVKGIPEHLAADMNTTTGHELLGQSVCYAPFVAVGELLGNAFRKPMIASQARSLDLLSAA